MGRNSRARGAKDRERGSLPRNSDKSKCVLLLAPGERRGRRRFINWPSLGAKEGRKEDAFAGQFVEHDGRVDL